AVLAGPQRHALDDLGADDLTTGLAAFALQLIEHVDDHGFPLLAGFRIDLGGDRRRHVVAQRQRARGRTIARQRRACPPHRDVLDTELGGERSARLATTTGGDHEDEHQRAHADPTRSRRRPYSYPTYVISHSRTSPSTVTSM